MHGSGPRPVSLHPDATRRSLAFATGLVALALVAAPALRDRRTLLRASVALVAAGVAVALYGLVARVVFANKLYGITFTPRPDLPVYNPEVQAFEVKDADGTHLGVYYTDYHSRPGKGVGAWSSSFRTTRLKDGQRVTPVVVNVCNFSRPAGDRPALLSLEEVQTLFHESGHALNSLLARSPLPRARSRAARRHRAAVADYGELGARA